MTSKYISWNNTASFSKTLMKYFLQRLCKETCNISWNIMGRCWKHFSKRCFSSDRTIQETFLKPCKNISRDDIRKPFKNISCIIAWNGLAKFSQRFEHGLDIVKTNFEKFYCKVLQSFPEIFLASFLYRNNSWNITITLQNDVLKRFFYETDNKKKKIFRKPRKIFHKRL